MSRNTSRYLRTHSASIATACSSIIWSMIGTKRTIGADMGEHMQRVMVAVPESMAQRMDTTITECAPFVEGRSQMGRLLFTIAFSVIDERIVELDVHSLQRLLGNHAQRGEQSITAKPPQRRGISLEVMKRFRSA